MLNKVRKVIKLCVNELLPNVEEELTEKTSDTIIHKVSPGHP